MRIKGYLWFRLVFFIIVLAVTASIFAHVSKTSLPDNINTPHIFPAAGTVEVAFSPSGGITKSGVKNPNYPRNTPLFLKNCDTH
jgi:hypothetical protein